MNGPGWPGPGRPPMDMPADWRRDTLVFYWTSAVLFLLFAGWVVGLWLTQEGPAPRSLRSTPDTGRVVVG